MNLSQFTEKLNKVDGNIHVIEELVQIKDGVYEGELKHDNINTATLAVYTGPKLTGERLESYVLSTPSLTPWKKVIRVYAEVPTVYISYETDGDTVEADDINRVQEAVTETQTALNAEAARTEAAEEEIAENLQTEIGRAKNEEARLDARIDTEAERAAAAEKSNTDAITAEANRAKEKEAELQSSVQNETGRATLAESEIRNSISTNRPNWEDKYTRNEVDNKFSTLETAIDWKEAVDTYADLAAVYPDPEDGWTANVKDTDYTYRWSGAAWIAISANAIPKATQSVDGLLTKEDKTAYDAAYVHLGNSGNPHAVTKTQVGLGNADNTSDADKPVSTAVQAALDKKSPLEGSVSLKKLGSQVTFGGGAAFSILQGDGVYQQKIECFDNSSDGDAVYRFSQSEDTGVRYNTLFEIRDDGDAYTGKGQVYTTGNKPSKSDVGLGSVPDVTTNDQTPTFTQASTLANLISGERIAVSLGKMMKAIAELISHKADLVKHITAAERTAWSDADSKKHTHGNKGVVDKLTQAMLDKLGGIAAGAERNVQPDWSETNTASDAYVKNKPVSMPASDVAAWAKAAAKPSYAWTEIAGKPGVFTPAEHEHSDLRATVTSSNTSDTSQGQFCKLATVKITRRYGYVSKAYECIISEHGFSNSDFRRLYFWIKQQDAFGNDPYIFLSVMANDAAIERVQFCAVVDELNAEFTQVSLYVKIINTYITCQLFTMSKVERTGSIAYFDKSEFISALPDTGTVVWQTDCSGKHAHTKSQIADMPTKLSQFANDPGFITQVDVDTSQNHIHANRSLLDTLTQALLDKWSAAHMHIGRKDNPHGVTKSQVGLGNVPNVMTNDQTPSYSQAPQLANLTSGETLSVSLGKVMRTIADLISHKADAVLHLTAAERTRWNTVESKVDRISGKGLSTNDYTDSEKSKLSGIAAGAESNVQSDWNVTDTTSDAYVKNKPVSLPASDVAAWAKAAAKPSYAWTEIAGKPGVFTPAQHEHSDLRRTVTSSDSHKTNQGQFCKLATVMIDGQFGVFSRTYECMTGNHGGRSSDFRRLSLWIRQQDPLENDPYIYLSVMANDTTLERVQFCAVVDELNAEFTQVSLYVKIISDYTFCRLFTVSKIDSMTSVEYFDESEFISVLPDTGTVVWQTDCSGKHAHAISQITDMPTKLSQFVNDSGYVTSEDLDTSQNHMHPNKTVLDKISQALLDKWNSALTSLPIHTHTKAQITDFPASLPANGGNAATVNGHVVNEDVPAGAKFTDTVYTHPGSGVTAGNYRSVTVNAQGHVTAGSNPTTLAGYGITDAAGTAHNHDSFYLKKGAVTWDDLKGGA